ncbi:MAG TPA: alpha/beta hydrolase [Aromatoleum sp.]|uniref:alpha/beta hydrolase n=1 Tax=Aromatoleum sp. TaxID=2307007 RepID=UPI002B46439C|nr:alpha/beta hydrolase [Aromatoleum sp.]HJV26845.1 alpha/beta hydrolase [Aromatoleum sp.]
MPLTAQAQSLLDMVYRVGAPRFHELSVPQARHSFEKLQFAFGGERVAVSSVVDVPMRLTDSGDVLLGRSYRPLGVNPLDVLPLVIYLHGGGWCIGDVASYDGFCRRLANASGCSVLSVDYRLAPEHSFPAAVHDSMAALEWAQENHGLLEIDPGRISLAGDSAGGNLALVAALEARDRGLDSVRELVLIYPSTQIHSDRPSRERFSDGYFLDRESLEWFFARYLPQGDALDWRTSPFLADSLAGLPPILLLMAEYDPLVDDCLAFAARVEREGGAVDRVTFDGVVHGFVTLPKLFPEASAAIDVIAERLRRL